MNEFNWYTPLQWGRNHSERKKNCSLRAVEHELVVTVPLYYVSSLWNIMAELRQCPVVVVNAKREIIIIGKKNKKKQKT